MRLKRPDLRTVFIPSHALSVVARVTFAVVAVAIAALLRAALAPALGEGVPFIVFYPTVVLCGWYGGLWTGLLAAALGGLVAWFAFIPPHYSFAVADPMAPGQLALFLLSSGLISLLAESLHRARRRAEDGERHEREGRERLRVTLASVGDAVIATDAAGRVTLMNGVARALTGWDEGDAIGRRLEEVFVIVNEYTRQPVENPVGRVLREGVITGLANHTVLVAKDGGEIPIDDSAAPIRTADGRVVGAVMVFRDLSQRRRDEATFRQVIEGAPHANVMVSRSGRIVLINAYAERLFGYSRAELIGEPVETLVPSRHRSAHVGDRAAFHRAPEMRAMGVGRELYGVRKDGREVPIEIGLSPLDIGGETLVLASIIDITERKQAEKEHAKLASMLESSFDAIMILDAWDRITSWNRGAMELYGWTREEALGRVAHLLFQTKFPEPLDEILADLSRDGRWEGELVHTCKDGRVITVFSRWTLERDAHAKRTAVLETNMDITERKRAENALRDAYDEASKRQREAESLATVARTLSTLEVDAVLQTITESACAMLEADVATVFRLEPNAETMLLVAVGGPHVLSRSRDALPRGSGLVWLAVDRREAVVSPDLLKDERFVYGPEMRARVEAASHRVGLAAPLIVQGQITGALFVAAPAGRVFSPDEIRLVTTFADQAAVAMANAELYEEARRANSAKDEFLAMLSHELRTPLSTILGWARSLRSHQVAPDRLEQALASIERNAQLQARLMEDLLDVSRIVSGKLALEVQPVDLERVVEAALETVRAQAETAGIQLTEDVEGGIPSVAGDATRLQQVVWNLLSNAVKFTARGGRVDIRVRRQAGGIVELVVQDAGRGIRPEFLPHVFDRFRQAELTGSRAGGGLGLGLTIVRHLVQGHGGTVEAASPGEGQGATFTVRLPLASGLTGPAGTVAVPDAPPASPAAPVSLAGVRILVVEDDTDMRQLLEAVLRAARAEVRSARSVGEALDVFDKGDVDALVSDLSLASQDGYALIRHIRAREAPPERLVAIAVTAHARDEDRIRALAAGFDAYVPKPVDPGDLVALLARLCEANRP